MDRREYLIGTSVGIGAVVVGRTGVPTVAQGGGLERLAPDESVSVQPGTTVLFEAALPDGAEPTDVEWETDVEDGPLLGADYGYATETAAHSPTFETTGTHEVRASYGGDEVVWTVEVTDDAPGTPTIEELSCDPDDETVGVEDPVEVSASVADPAGELAQVVWKEGRNHTVYDTAGVEGEQDEATLSVDGGSHWLSAGYPTMARAVAADGRVSELESVDGPDVRQPFAVEIQETNAPVEAGDELEVTAEVAHDGDMMMVGPNEQEVRLVVGGETVDSETVTLDWNETETLTLGYETYEVRSDVEFPVTVECDDDADETMVRVYADGVPGDVTIDIEATNAPVAGGEELQVEATVTNEGDHEASEELRLVVGGETVDRESVSLDPGEDEWVVLGYTTYAVEQDVEFPVQVVGESDSDEITVEVTADEPEGELGVAISWTTAPVTGGEFLEVVVSVGNNATTEATGTIELVVGGEVVDSQTVEVPGEATQTIALGYDTYPVQREVTFDVVVRSDHDQDSTSVTVLAADDAQDGETAEATGEADGAEPEPDPEPNGEAGDETNADAGGDTDGTGDDTNGDAANGGAANGDTANGDGASGNGGEDPGGNGADTDDGTTEDGAAEDGDAADGNGGADD